MMGMLMLEATRNGKRQTTNFSQLSKVSDFVSFPLQMIFSPLSSSDCTTLLPKIEEFLGMVKLLGLPLCVTVALRGLCQGDCREHSPQILRL